MLHAVILSRFHSIFFRLGSRRSRSFSRTFCSPVSASLPENKGVFNRKKTSPITPSLSLYSSELLILRCLFSLFCPPISTFYSLFSPLSPLFFSPQSVFSTLILFSHHFSPFTYLSPFSPFLCTAADCSLPLPAEDTLL